MDDLMRYLKGKARLRGALPKLFDECIYTPYSYTTGQPQASSSNTQKENHPRRYSDSATDLVSDQIRRSDQLRDSLIDMHGQGEGDAENGYGFYTGRLPQFGPEQSHDGQRERHTPDFDIEVHTPEVFLFNYGTVVIWGMTLQQEQRVLKEIAKFEVEKLAKDDVQTEDFNFYYTREYQARIYNDFISLMDKKNYMTKLAISHALSQSVKVSFLVPSLRPAAETNRHHCMRTWWTTLSKRPKRSHRGSPPPERST
jgi:uncharacterized Rmd1/YagE family protein